MQRKKTKDLKEISDMKKVLRWICVLPATILTYFVAGLIQLLLNKFFVVGSFYEYLATLFVMYASAAISILVGKYVAPDYKKNTGIIIATALSVIVLIIGIMATIGNIKNGEKLMAIESVLGTLAMIAGFISGNLYKEEDFI